MNYAIQDYIRTVWQRDPNLNEAIPVAENELNRLFEEGVDLRGVPAPYAVIIDTGVSGQQNLGDHAFFEIRTFFVRIYCRNRKQLLDLSRRFRLVFSNLHGDQTQDGCICASRVSGGQMTMFPSGTRMIQHNIQFSVAENRGPARLRATTQHLET